MISTAKNPMINISGSRKRRHHRRHHRVQHGNQRRRFKRAE